MTMKDIREKAKALKVANYSRMRKDELIREIQAAEGNNPCFGTIPDCKQMDCCWMEDCLPT